MSPYRSNRTMEGRRMAGARALWRATGLKDEDFEKPVIAIANSFTQFVPGHVHLKEYGQMVKRMIEDAGGVGVEFNTIAIDDGIAMGHGGMLYSLPSRELIADSVEYMVNAHCADGLVCISSCDKITPGMLMGAMRLNVPAVFVTGGPMEAGHAKTSAGEESLDLIDAMVRAADSSVSTEDLEAVEKAACPTCGSCSGMFTANSMNCLTEALGLALPGNGTLLATHKLRRKLFEQASERIVRMCEDWYQHGDDSVLPRSIANAEAFENAMALDIAMGGSTNTVLHILAVAEAAGVSFSMAEIDALSRKVPCLCKVAPSSSYHVEDVSHAGGIPVIMGELRRAGLIHDEPKTVTGTSMGQQICRNDIRDVETPTDEFAEQRALAAPGGVFCIEGLSQDNMSNPPAIAPAEVAVHDLAHAYSRDGGLCVLYGNLAPEGAIVKTAGVDPDVLTFTGKAVVCDSQDQAVDTILSDVEAGDVVVIRYEGPSGGPGMQEMLYPTSYLKSRHLDKECALITDGRFSGGTSGLSIGHVSPEAAHKGPIGLLRNGDTITINIPERKLEVDLSDRELNMRREEMEARGTDAWSPEREREVSDALKAFGKLATSAANGAVRSV